MFLQKLRLILFNRKFILFKLAFILSVICFTLIAVFNDESILITRNENWSITGQFIIDGTYTADKSEINSIISRKENIDLWGSWAGNDKHTGKLVSPTFKAPAILSIFVAGYPNISGNKLFIERIDSNQRLTLKVLNPQERWANFNWLLPFDWRNTTIRLVAIDGATGQGGWLGVSSPRKTNWFSLISHQISSLVILPLYILNFGLFLLPGIFGAFFMVQRNYLNKAFTLIMSIMISSMIGYVIFWIYLVNYDVGKGVSASISLISVFGLVLLFQKKYWLKLLSSLDILLPTLLMFFVGIFYISILYIINSGQSLEIIAQWRFFNAEFPPDNVIPMLFANRLYLGQDPRNLLGDWLSSDRPPLQAGLMLIQRPLMTLIGLDTDFHYQTLASIAQCAWIAAMWALCRTVGLSGRRIALVMAFAIFSGFFFYNSVYVWPKLLAGSLVVFAFTLLLQPVLASRRPSTIQVGLAAAATALGMLAHGGVIFTLPAIALIVIKPKCFPDIRRLLIGCAIFAILLAPWSAYQKFYEPPGNRLVKWHIGGVVPIDQRSLSQTIIDSYRSLSPTEIIKNKWENLKVLVVGRSRLNQINAYEARRLDEFYNLFQSLSFLNISWLIIIINFFLKRLILLSKTEAKSTKLIFGVSLISLAFWILVMFGPGTTFIHHGSYATMILLFAGLGIVVASIPGWIPYFILCIQIFAFTVIWILNTPPVAQNMLLFMPNIPLIILTLVNFSIIFMLLKKLSVSQMLSDTYMK